MKRKVTSSWQALSGLLFLLLAACGPVLSWRRIHHSAVGHRIITVRRGENLYAIAWRYGLDYHTLARWNGIVFPYTIYPGERLRLYPPTGGVAGTARSTGVIPVLATHRYGGGWVWPARGRIFTLFTGSGFAGSGIDIKGRVGEPIRAAHAGRVLYAGSGIPAYGRLIIIRDSSTMLTAYAFNQKILVHAGEVVHAGEIIATMGRHDGRPLLHFEVRHDGRPVDPLHYVSPP